MMSRKKVFRQLLSWLVLVFELAPVTVDQRARRWSAWNQKIYKMNVAAIKLQWTLATCITYDVDEINCLKPVTFGLSTTRLNIIEYYKGVGTHLFSEQTTAVLVVSLHPVKSIQIEHKHHCTNLPQLASHIYEIIGLSCQICASWWSR